MSASEEWSTEVSTTPPPLRSSGWYVGLSGQMLTAPQDGWGSGGSFDQMYWGSVQIGRLFGDRFAHGPELELGYHSMRGTFEVEDPVNGDSDQTVTYENVHLGVAYRFTVDLWREPKAALFFGGRLAFGSIADPNAYDSPAGNLYLETEVSLGIRFALGPTVVRVSFGPAIGAYELYVFTSYQATVAVGL